MILRRLSAQVVLSSLLTVVAFVPRIAESGTIGTPVSAPSSSAAFDCDRPVSMKLALSPQFCSQDRKNLILDACFLIVHNSAQKIAPCTWQGCGAFSIVGKPATLSGANFVEYGVATPHQNAPSVEVAGGVLPQRPFERHYLTIRSAVQALNNKCAGLPSDVAQLLCSVPETSLGLSPYLACARLP